MVWWLSIGIAYCYCAPLLLACYWLVLLFTVVASGTEQCYGLLLVDIVSVRVCVWSWRQVLMLTGGVRSFWLLPLLTVKSCSFFLVDSYCYLLVFWV